MFGHGISTERVARAQWPALILCGLFALCGLIYLYYRAEGGDIFGALIGAAIALGSVLAGYTIHWTVQLAKLAEGNRRRLAQLGRRLDALQLVMEDTSSRLNLASLGSGDPAPLVAARTNVDAFPRIARDEPQKATGRMTPAGHTHLSPGLSPGNAEHREPLPRQEIHFNMRELRLEFRASVRAGDYASALAVGTNIAATFPGSRMAAQFEELRGRLERLAARESTTIQTPVV